MGLLLLASLAAAQEAVDPRRVDGAIRKAVEFLKTAPSPAEGEGMGNSDELILLTLIHAGVPETDPRLRELLQGVLQAPLTHTYKVALQAMALEELDRVKHQHRIFHCAQFLVDNQDAAGRWGYGKPTTLVDPPGGTPTPGPPRKAATPRGAVDFGAPPAREKPAVLRKITVRRQRQLGDGGDNSNSQYAALGLRACHDAGIVLPQETVTRAAEWWRRSQEGAEAEADDDRPKRKPVATGAGPARPRGWGYSGGEAKVKGSMTAGAVGALVIYDYILGKDWKKDANVGDGMAWLASKFTVKENPGGGREWHFYYLYALERVGLLYDTPTLGRHAWYPAGANYLLGTQKPDGSWRSADDEEETTTWDTCFAVLFLKRSTRPLVDVASVDPLHRPPGSDRK